MIEPGSISIRSRRAWYDRPVWRAVGWFADLVTKGAVWALASTLGAIMAVNILLESGQL